MSAQFARERVMLKLPEESTKWGESKGAGRGRGERRENYFFLPSPSPLSFFRPRTYRKGYYFYSPQSSTVIKSKMVATTILRTRTKVSPTQNTPVLQASARSFLRRHFAGNHRWCKSRKMSPVFSGYCIYLLCRIDT